MTYFKPDIVFAAVAELEQKVHPFFGITFLACKKAGFPVGSGIPVSLDRVTRDFLEENHRIDPSSSFYLQPFKSVKQWVDQRYPSTGLQAVNTQTFEHVFIHAKGSVNWGLASNYIDVLRSKLKSLGYPRAPIASLAIWLLKGRRLATDVTVAAAIDAFITEYRITDEERQTLFYDDSALFSETTSFQTSPPDNRALLNLFMPAPDSPTQVGGRLRSLKLEFIGPAPSLEIELGKRLTIVTGDNGLGKSFLLEAAWWAMTGNWPDQQAVPFLSDTFAPMTDVTPNISYEIEDQNGRISNRQSNFDWASYSWFETGDHLSITALAIFTRADGSFSVSDPLRANLGRPGSPPIDQFTQHELWNGSKLTEGLVRDWIKWEQSPDQTDFETFKGLLSHLSPDDLGVLRPDASIRIPGEPRDIPTVRHKYGKTPIIYASAGVQRVIGLAYLMVWAWKEHRIAAQQQGATPFEQLVLFVDELEAHLHPKWQRTVLPAILEISRPLKNDRLDIQTVAATHSPMVLASIESLFDDKTDKIYHLSLVNNVVELELLDFVKYGDVSAWLTSPVFGLRYARSTGAESAIEKAKALQLADVIDAGAVAAVTTELRRALAPDDKFWPRWIYFAEQHGVSL